MRCFLVVGPERSGNRLVASILVAGGCQGEGATFQPFRRLLPTTEDPAVMIRSLPHGTRWPNLGAIHRKLRARGYDVTVIAVCRDMACTVGSQVASGVASELAEANIQRAYRDVFRFAGRAAVDLVVVPYESLVLHPVGAPAALLRRLGLGPVKLDAVTVEGLLGPISDRNAQYYEWSGVDTSEGDALNL